MNNYKKWLILSLFIFIIFPVKAQLQIFKQKSNKGYKYKKSDLYLDTDAKIDIKRKELNSFIFYTGGIQYDSESYPYNFIGLGYERIIYDYLGIMLNIKSGRRSLKDNTIYDYSNYNNVVLNGYQYFNVDAHSISIAPKFYLSLDDKDGFYLFASFDIGIYFTKSFGKIVTKDEKIFSQEITSPTHLYNQLSVGAELFFAKKFSVSGALCGENIKFKENFNNINWQVSWAKNSAPNNSIYYNLNFKFHF